MKLLANMANKLKEFYNKTIQYAKDNNWVNYLHNELMSRNFEDEVKKIRSGINDIIKTEHFEILHLKKTDLLNQIIMLGEILKDILSGISHVETRKKTNPEHLLLINDYADMTDNEKFSHMSILVQQNLGFQVASDN